MKDLIARLRSEAVNWSATCGELFDEAADALERDMEDFAFIERVIDMSDAREAIREKLEKRMISDREQPQMHQGLPVHGYKPQDPEKVALVNRGKLIEELAMRWLDDLNDAFGLKPPLTDPRMVAIAKTQMQGAFMWAARSVFQPGRITTPDEELLQAIKGDMDAARTDADDGGD